jgi:hypothetical protein
VNEARLKHEPISVSIVPAHVHDLGNSAVAIDASDVHDHVNRERDRLAGTSMREADIRRQDAMRKARECLLGRVCMDCAHAPKMAGVESLKKVECFSPAYLANENTVWSMPECRAQQIRNRHRRQWSLVSKWRLGPPGFQPHDVWFVQVYFSGFLNHHDAVATWDVCGQRVEQCGLPRASSARDQNVPLVVDRSAESAGHGGRKRTDVN